MLWEPDRQGKYLFASSPLETIRSASGSLAQLGIGVIQFRRRAERNCEDDEIGAPGHALRVVSR